MNRTIGIALLAIGITLVVFGVQASNSTASGVSRFFNGTPTNKTMGLLVGGIASILTG